MGPSAPKISRVGRQASVVMKPKPKAFMAGSEPMTSDAITPMKISSTNSAAASAIRRKRVSPPLARRVLSTRARAEVSVKLISVKRGPGEV